VGVAGGDAREAGVSRVVRGDFPFSIFNLGQATGVEGNFQRRCRGFMRLGETHIHDCALRAGRGQHSRRRYRGQGVAPRWRKSVIFFTVFDIFEIRYLALAVAANGRHRRSCRVSRTMMFA
jgi:hypothetical protein